MFCRLYRIEVWRQNHVFNIFPPFNANLVKGVPQLSAKTILTLWPIIIFLRKIINNLTYQKKAHEVSFRMIYFVSRKNDFSSDSKGFFNIQDGGHFDNRPPSWILKSDFRENLVIYSEDLFGQHCVNIFMFPIFSRLPAWI